MKRKEKREIRAGGSYRSVLGGKEGQKKVGGAGERCVGGGSKLKGKLEKARLGRGKKK